MISKLTLLQGVFFVQKKPTLLTFYARFLTLNNFYKTRSATERRRNLQNFPGKLNEGYPTFPCD